MASRHDELRVLAARVYRLAEDASQPSYTHRRAERLIHEAETVAHELRGMFR
jgi:hypothetical protein